MGGEDHRVPSEIHGRIQRLERYVLDVLEGNIERLRPATATCKEYKHPQALKSSLRVGCE